MAAIQCSYCKYNIIGGSLEPDSLCPNCGNALTSTAFKQTISSKHTVYAKAQETTAPSMFTAPSFSSQSSARTERAKGSDRFSAFNNASKNNEWRLNTNTDPETPIVVNVEPDLARKGWSPWHNPPVVKGVIVHQQTQSAQKRHDGIFEIIMFELFNILWPVQGGQSRAAQQQKQKQITLVRVRSADNKQHEVRLEGDFTLGSLALGDEVSVWGRKRKGTLIMHKAFNHTTDARVVVRVPMDEASSGVLILLGLMLVLLIGAVWMHWLTFTPWPTITFPH